MHKSKFMHAKSKTYKSTTITSIQQKYFILALFAKLILKIEKNKKKQQQIRPSSTN